MGVPCRGSASRRARERQVTAGVFLIWLGVVALSAYLGVLQGHVDLTPIVIRTVLAVLIWCLSIHSVRTRAVEAEVLAALEVLPPEEFAERIARDLRELGFVARVVSRVEDGLDSTVEAPLEAEARQELGTPVAVVPGPRRNGSGPSDRAQPPGRGR